MVSSVGSLASSFDSAGAAASAAAGGSASEEVHRVYQSGLGKDMGSTSVQRLLNCPSGVA